jgi:signal transduction histidine kinase/DNA-binding response OmpR family regulator
MRILTLTITHEADVVITRQRARQIAGLLGFDTREQTWIATAVSEIARNAFAYANGGKVEFTLEGKTSPQIFLIAISDCGPGITNLQTILDGTYKSSTGMGLGILGARRLMDQCEIRSLPEHGTAVHLKKLLPTSVPLITPARLTQISTELTQRNQHDLLAEIQQQNQELLQTLAELRERQEELLRLNRELEDTNRGVVALYAELDEKADHLRRADELKTRFLSNMSHEFRTPVNSILALSHLLLDRIDGELTAEQDKQIRFIRRGAEALRDLIDDLLDIAKIEAGKVTIKPAEFTVYELFSTLRGMLRPLLASNAITLNFEDPKDLPPMYTDESKVSQILRNFLSNALKFTERGEVRVSATLTADKQSVVFSVADTGIGIAPCDQDIIFEEFTQVDNPIQKRVKGTGLGLPLCKRLAELLGGEVSVQSTVGVGSTFSVTLPLSLPLPTAEAPVEGFDVAEALDSSRLPILVVEDDSDTRFIYNTFIHDSSFQPLFVRTVQEAEQMLLRVRPRAIILDILLPGKDAWTFLATLKGETAVRDIPILVISTVEDPRKGLALGADAYEVKPVTRERLLAELTRLTTQQPEPRVLIIDDEEVSRYVLRQYLNETHCTIIEAASGIEGLQKAHAERPQVIFLDLSMPEMDGRVVLEKLTTDPATQDIPIVINTSKTLREDELAWFHARARAVLSKGALSQKVVSELMQTIVQGQSSQ